MKISAIIQARMGSTRLPKKTFIDLCGKPLLFHVVERLKYSRYINSIVIATTNLPQDDIVENWAKENCIDFFRGSVQNVLNRYYEAAKKFNSDLIVRVTADDPFKDYRIIDHAIETLIENKLDFVCNNNPPTYPEGLDVEVLTYNCLKKCYKNAKSNTQKEHVTQYIHQNIEKFKTKNIRSNKNYSNYRWTIDTSEDYVFVNKIYRILYKQDSIFLTEEIYNLLESNKEFLKINSKVQRSIQYK